MSNPRTQHEPVSVDDLLLHDWAAAGIVALEGYLDKHAALAAYLAELDGRGQGDGADRR